MVGSSRVVAAALACLLAAGPALAQPATEPTPQQRQKAEKLVKQAIAKSQAKDHAAAIELYLQAYALVPLASLLSNVGTEYQQDGKPVEALKYFCMYLEKEPTGPVAKYATAQAAGVEAELGDQDTSTVCQPIVEKPVAPPPTEPAAVLEPVAPIDAPARPGKTLKLGGLVIGAAGIVGLGGGTFFALRGQRLGDKINNHNAGEMWPDGVEDIDAQGRFANKMAVALFITGGVLVTAGVVMYVAGTKKDSAVSGVAITPSLGPDGGGLVLGGAF